MTAMKTKPGPAGEARTLLDPPRGKAPAESALATGPQARAVSEFVARGPEEIQDHLSLVARIEVKIGQLLETSIDELERAQRLETLTSLIRGGAAGREGAGSDPFAGDRAERPGAYLEREIKALKKMRQLLGIRNQAGAENESPAAGLARGYLSVPETGEAETGRKILIIYHDPGTVRILRYFLEKDNFEVVACSNGLDGLRAAADEHPDLILLDILLPGMDGYQVLGRLKKDPGMARIPVFVLTVLAQESDILKAVEGGAADYFVRPFSPPIILAKIRRALQARHE